MAFDDKKAIREMLKSVLNHCVECRDLQAFELLEETIENCKIAYGSKAGEEIVSVIMDMQDDTQTTLVELWARLKEVI